MASDNSALDSRVLRTDALPNDEWNKLLELFRASYREANASYLQKSLKTFRYVALTHEGPRLMGFAFGETRIMDLPRLPDQVVSLAGICCIVPEMRRRGLFGSLMQLSIKANEVPDAPRRLVCGRFAHPAAMRVFRNLPTAVPRPGVRPTPWQQEVGAAVAEAYGVHDFDPETFVCIGSGVPIGYPNLDFKVEPGEWEVFRPVDRDRGDALLSIGWGPDAPPGW
jgi:hypothetical protein